MSEIKNYNYTDKGLIKIWSEFYCGNKYIFPYSSRQYNDVVYDCFRFKLSSYFKKEIFTVYYDSNVPRILAPLTKRGKELRFYGENTQAGHLDFLYSEQATKKDFDNLFFVNKQELQR